MSGYFAGLMRQTGIGAAAAPSPLSAPSSLAAAPAAFAVPDAPAPLEQDVVVDAAPSGRDASADLPRPQPPAPPFFPAPPPSAAAPSAPPPPPPGAPAPPPFATAPAAPRPRSDAADPPSSDLPARTVEPPAPLEVTVSREAFPPPPPAVPPAIVTEHVAVPFPVDAPASPRGPVAPPPAAPLIEVVERMVAREAEAGPPEPPVRGIPDERPRPRPAEPRRTPAVPPRGEPPVAEVADETPAPPPARVHSFAEVLAEARRWVAATPAPGEAARVQVEAAETDAGAPAPAGTRPRRAPAGVAEVSEDVHVSIGAITVTIEDPAAARPAPRAEAPRAEPDWRSRLARHYLRPE